MGNSTPDREATEALWRKRVADAKARLDFATSYVKEVQQDLQSGAVPPPARSFALVRALRAETLSLAEYERVLRIFTELVMEGKIPNEGESLGWKAADAD